MTPRASPSTCYGRARPDGTETASRFVSSFSCLWSQDKRIGERRGSRGLGDGAGVRVHGTAGLCVGRSRSMV